MMLLFLHVFANLLWVGGLLGMGLVLSGSGVSPRERGSLALRLYFTLAVPGMLLSLAAGGARLVMGYQLFFVVTHFMHGKLLAGLVLLALHHLLGGRAKRMAAGRSESAVGVKLMTVGVALAAAAASILAVLKPF